LNGGRCLPILGAGGSERSYQFLGALVVPVQGEDSVEVTHGGKSRKVLTCK
jgi:hypothetical protein